MKIFVWDTDKNEKLKKERGVSFESAIEAISAEQVVDDFPHPNKKKYPNQRIMVVIIDGYAYLIPYADDGKKYVFKTIIPSRKAQKKYINKKKEDV